MSFDRLLNQLCNILAKTQAQTASGAITESWAAVKSSVAVRLNPDRSAANDQTIGNISTQQARFYFSGSEDTIAEGVLIEMQDTSYRWEVLSAVKDSSGDHWEVTAKRVFYD